MEAPSTPAPRLVRRSKSRACLLAVAMWLTIGAAVPTVAGSCAPWGWPLELMCHFRVQYLAALIVSLLLLSLLRRWRRAAFAGIFAAWNLALIAPLCISPAASIKPAGSEVTWRFIAANVFSGNRTPERVAEYLRAEQPDVVVIAELTPAWEGRMAELSDLFPYSHVEPREGNFGIGLYSRQPLESSETLVVAGGNLAIRAQVRKSGQSLTVIGAHVYPPGGSRTAMRDRQLLELAQVAAAADGPCVLLGDLNTTSWSPGFSLCLRESGLRDSRRGFGVQPTWPAGRALLRIPIDHCLVSVDLRVTGRSAGPDVGSDHLPIRIELAGRIRRPDG